MVTPEKLHRGSVICTKYGIFKNKYAGKTVSDQRGHEFERNQ